MDSYIIKNVIENYQWATIDDIEEALCLIAKYKMEQYGIDISFSVVYDAGGAVKLERTIDNKIQVEIGILPFYNAKENKDFDSEKSILEEKKEFIELILQMFHELRHVVQINNMLYNPVYNYETIGMTRELIINEVFPGFIVRFNYESSFSEIDAMKTSLVETVSFFQTFGLDIKADDVFQVMKEKELSYLNYNLDDFGDSYESAIDFFNKIYGNCDEIKGFPELLTLLTEEQRRIFDTECYELKKYYIMEENIDRKLDILMEIALTINPKLYNKYPLSMYLKNKKK